MPSLNPDGLAAAMEAAMPQAWQDVKNTPFAGGDPNDRKPLFLAISRAVLKYLHDNQSGLIKTIGFECRRRRHASRQYRNQRYAGYYRRLKGAVDSHG